MHKFGLQSFWFELGERSYMKETLALLVGNIILFRGLKQALMSLAIICWQVIDVEMSRSLL